MIGYKAFNADMTCRDMQYEIGKSYEMDGEIKLCNKGYHFCENIADCFAYYGSDDARFAKIEAYGDVIKSDEDSKCVTNKIRIVEEISRDEAVKMSNSGDCNSGDCNSGDWNSGNKNSGNWNSGNRNSGDCNSGNRNSGNCNSGNWNSGDCNSGDWNSGNKNSGNWNSGNWNSGDCNSGDWNRSSYNNGCFMTVKPVIMLFNKPTEWTIEDWWNSDARDIMRDCPTKYTDTKWVYSSDMTDEEKKSHPEHTTTGGYLKEVKQKADRQKWWDDLSDWKKWIVMNLPNFNANIFYECTGIRVEAEGES